jgi:pyrimidine-nucleoside phosphorylase
MPASAPLRRARARQASAAAAPPLDMTTVIARKRDGEPLEPAIIGQLVAGISSGAIPDYQLAAFLMAVVFRGLEPAELRALTVAMIDSGDRLSLEAVAGKKIDKHSTGGVGDKITLCLAPLVAACGVPAPMLVGRALGHTGGTLDKLESIPGFRHQLTPRQFTRVLAGAGFVIAGQTPRLVPADRRMYALRDATATVESIPLIASSILSKKVAGGADALVLDVKVGRGAFLPSERATRALARTLVDLGKQLGLPTVALLTAMDEPLGRAVGNACELAEALDILRGQGPPDVRALTVRLGAEMLRLGGVAATLREGAQRIEQAIASGAGMERLLRGVRLQGGDPRVLEDPRLLPRARRQLVLRASRGGYVVRLDARAIGRAATMLGAGRLVKEDTVDAAVGVILHAKEGEEVKRDGPLATLCYNGGSHLAVARNLAQGAYSLGARTRAARALIRDRIA